MSNSIRLPGAVLLFLALGLAGQAEENRIANEADVVGPPPASNQDESFAAPGSVGGQLKADREKTKSDHLLPISQTIEDEWGLTFGLDYNALWLGAVSPNHTDAAGGVARFYGEWKPFHKTQENPGRLVFKVENRHRLGTDLSPQGLGPSLGYAGLNGITFSDAGSLLTNLYWKQTFFDNRFAFVAGVVDVTDYLDVYGLVNPWVEFNNLAFSTNPTIAAPSQGLGAAVRVSLTPNYYILAGIADANGNPSEPDQMFDSFFDTDEYFKHVEFGWIGSWEKRFTDNIHLTFWQIDSRQAGGVDDGNGVSFSASRLFQDRWLPFIRAGYSDGGGAFVDRSVSVGTGYKLNEENDYIGFGANWGRPPRTAAVTAPSDQHTFELYYRKNLFDRMQIVPSVQFIANPANAPTSDNLWIFGLRARVVF